MGQARYIDLFNGFDKFDRRYDLSCQKVLDIVRPFRIGLGMGIGNDPAEPGVLKGKGVQIDPQLCRCLGQQGGMEGPGQIQFFKEDLLLGQKIAEFFNIIGPAGHGRLFFTVFIGDINMGHKGFSDELLCFLLIFKYHHDLSRNLHGCLKHEVRAFDDKTHGIGKGQHPATEKGCVFPHAVTDIIIRGKSFQGQTAVNCRRRKKNRGLGVLGRVDGLIRTEHHVQKGISPLFDKDLLAFFHDHPDMGVFFRQVLHHPASLGSLAGKKRHHPELFPPVVRGIGMVHQYDIIPCRDLEFCFQGRVFCFKAGRQGTHDHMAMIAADAVDIGGETEGTALLPHHHLPGRFQNLAILENGMFGIIIKIR